MQFLVEECQSITCSLTPERELISTGAALLCLRRGSRTDRKPAVVPGGCVVNVFAARCGARW